MNKQGKLTTTDIANKLGFSTQYIRNISKQLDLGTKEGKSFLFTNDEANKIAIFLNKDACFQMSNSKDFSCNEDEISLINVLQQTIRLLEDQLNTKDNQIQSLLKTNNQLSESLKALSVTNTVQIAADKRSLLLNEKDSQQQKKKSFLSRIFRKD